MAIIDNLNTLSTNLDNAKFKLAKNLKDKGVQALPSEKLDALADKVSTISGGGACNLQELNVTTNGVYTPQAGDIKGYNKVTVNVPQSGGLDWSAIGYSERPKTIDDGYNYAKQIYDTWDASQTNLYNKFKYDRKLIYMPIVDTSNAQDMGGIFDYCTSLTTVLELNTSNCTNMKSMFSNCTALTSIPELDTSKVQNTDYMFYYCTSLTTVPALNTSNCTNMSRMFQNCESLITIPALNTSNCTNMSDMFNGCTSLTSIPELDTSKAQKMSSTFNGCKKLTTIPALNTSNCTEMGGLFQDCESLITIQEIDFSKMTDMFFMFWRCSKVRFFNVKNLGMVSSVTEIDFSQLSNWGIDGDGVTDCLKTLKDSLITNSFDRATAGYEICTIKLAEETKSLLTEEEKTQIAAKGYTLA